MTDLFDLSGKLAVVTGASRGIGRAVALTLAQAGADIVGVSSSISPDGDVAREVTATGRRFFALRCDFSDRDSVRSVIDSLRRDHATVDILVNNAGTTRRQKIEEHSDQDFDAVIEVNLRAPFVLARELGRDMLARGRGKIVFTASLLSFQGGITVPGYAASKGGIARLVQAFANEWAGRGVNVNAVAPGYIDTDLTSALRADPKRQAAILERIPAARWGRPEDIAGAVLFLCSGAADYVHGVTLPVDGGWLGR